LAHGTRVGPDWLGGSSAQRAASKVQ
jgi:hypothetical protein